MPGPGPVRTSAGEAHAEQHVLQGREARQQVMGLKDVPDGQAAENVAMGLAHLRDIDRALVRNLKDDAAEIEFKIARNQMQ